MRSLRGLLSSSSCRNQLTNGFKLVKIRSTNFNSFFRSDANTVVSGDDGHFVLSCTSAYGVEQPASEILSTPALECRQSPLTV
jgi:hypothetical protein